MEAINVRLLVETVLVTAGFIGLVAVVSWSIYQGRRRTPNVISELTASNDELARRVRNLERSREQDHLTLLRLQTRLEVQNAYSRALADYADRLADRLRSLGEQNIPPAPSPPPSLSEPLVLVAMDERTLAAGISRHFDMGELSDLMFRLGVGDDDIKGETLGQRARALVRYMERRNRLDELIALVRLMRPEGGF